jgi:hypothetical protein
VAPKFEIRTRHRKAMTDHDEKNLDLDERIAKLKVARAELYYAITLTADDDLNVTFGTHSQWAGWSDPERLKEFRKARLVYPTYVILWEDLGQPYSIIHDADEITLFFLAGGNALVEKNLAEHVFSELLKPEAVVKDGVAGFKSSTMFPNSAFRRAPSPKVRMHVFKRDNRRYRIVVADLTIISMLNSMCTTFDHGQKAASRILPI